MKKRTFTGILCVTCFLSLTGCGIMKEPDIEEETTASAESTANDPLALISGQYYVWHDSSADSIKDDLSEDEKEKETIWNRISDLKYDIFTPVYYKDSTFTQGSVPNEYQIGVGRYIWIATEDESSVPILSPGDELIYYTTGDVPATFLLESFKEAGYSLGIVGLETDESNHVYAPLKEVNFASNSSAQAIFDTISAAKQNSNSQASKIILDKINEQLITKNNLDVEYPYINGLEKNGKYEVDAYYGTVHNKFELQADTLLLASSAENTTKSSDYTLYKSVVAAIKIPEGLPNGYYCINGAGVFYYRNNESSLNISKGEKALSILQTFGSIIGKLVSDYGI